MVSRFRVMRPATMKLSEMKKILAEGNLRLTRSLGQNFLHDLNQLHRIVAAAHLAPDDSVLEIGPGLGPLTEFLLAKARRVLAIEKDRRLVEILKRRFASVPHLTLVCEDALDYLKRRSVDWSECKLVANLPYSVAAPILVELAQATRPPRLMVVTLQLEVARRLMAGPGDEAYGVLTLLIQLRYQPQEWFKIPAGCFFPEPEVDSACVALVRRATPSLTERERDLFAKIVKRGFSQRRKMMLKLLKEDWPGTQLAGVFEQMRISPQERAENLSREQFEQLSRLLGATGASARE
jgi:16S rRNA (adenine1518-N6/adenine1519-N6)-dimethyltransferase